MAKKLNAKQKSIIDKWIEGFRGSYPIDEKFLIAQYSYDTDGITDKIYRIQAYENMDDDIENYLRSRCS